MSLRQVCEHEAAHAVVAAYYRIPVRKILAGPSRGRTSCDDVGSAAQNAAIDAAGDVWERELMTLPYRDGSCSDLATLERTVGAAGVWQARRDARAVLQRHRAAVLRLADRLEEHRALVNVHGHLVPALPATTGAPR